MYERMRAAVSHLRNDVQKIEDEVPRPSTEHILQGTKVRDVILRSFKIGHKRAALAEEEVSTTDASASAESGGIFKQDQRIQSWAKRYSQHNPMVMEGDPPLVGLNASQIRAMATMIGERMSLIQGVCPVFSLKLDARMN
jgi:regulator of nonsense transcripts 1